MHTWQVLRAVIATLKEIGAKDAFTDGDVQSAKYVTLHWLFLIRLITWIVNILSYYNVYFLVFFLYNT